MKTILHALILLLAFSLPFEIIHPILVLPWFEFTNLELLAAAALCTWIVQALILDAPRIRLDADNTMAQPARLERKTYAHVWLPMLFLSLSVLSAALAPAYRLDALKFVTRSAMGLAVFWMLIHTVRSHTYLVALLWAVVTGTGLSALMGLAEAAEWPGVTLLQGLFKEAPTRVGGELRVSASFQYATIAAMFFEMTVPLALALAATAQARLRRWVALPVALLGTVAVVLTFSRAGLLTLACVLSILLLAVWRLPPYRSLIRPTLLALGVLAATTGVLAWQMETFRTRLMTENDLGWYGANYTTPASLHLKAGEPVTVTVAVQNTGAAAWHATGENPFALGYYWLVDGQPVQQGHVEVPLPGPVASGDTVTLTVMLRPSLPPGDYQLVWGMLQHRILWFRHRNIPEAHTAVRIDKGSDVLTPLETAQGVPGGDMPELPPTVRRLDLWRAAVRMFADRPLLGVGPDNFRLLYGGYLNLPDWDRRLHANNLYLELLAGWGIAGTLAFAGLMAVIARRWLHLWRSATGAAAIWSLALGGSFLAFFVHGLLDYFLEFVPLYLLFWMVAGLIVALEQIVRAERATQ